MPNDPNPKDPFSTNRTELDSPGQYAIEIKPSDSAILSTVIRGLYIGTTGNVYCRPVATSNAIDSAANVLFRGAVAGTVLPVRMEAIWDTNTTCNNLVGLY